MRSADRFREVVKRGRRVGGPLLVVHAAGIAFDETGASFPCVGFIVPKKVGNAVRRNRIRRMLRHQLREVLADQPPVALVVRVQPAAGGASDEALRSELGRLVAKTFRVLQVAHIAVAPDNVHRPQHVVEQEKVEG